MGTLITPWSRLDSAGEQDGSLLSLYGPKLIDMAIIRNYFERSVTADKRVDSSAFAVFRTK